ncbi:MAG TPA: hypothetical protein VH234_02730 [Candidatus Saccharimonadales bacterium]|jgi:Tfp pilus assembly protein PilN|nr:hypothetical protein [Candidatus Saccharimonadales bacterium]
MINLLPPDLRNGYRYGRRNVVLRRWVAMCLVAFVGLGLLSTYGLLNLHQSTATYNNKITAANNTLQKEKFAQTEAQIKDIGSTFKLVTQVLKQEVLFSQLITRLAKTIPPGAKLNGLNISQTQGAINITAVAADYSTATQVQVNLSNPPGNLVRIFSKADITSVTCNSANAVDKSYPCTVNIIALFVPNNPFLLINSQADKALNQGAKP